MLYERPGGEGMSSDLEGKAAHVGYIEDGCLLSAVGGGLHDAVLVLHTTPHLRLAIAAYNPHNQL